MIVTENRDIYLSCLVIFLILLIFFFATLVQLKRTITKKIGKSCSRDRKLMFIFANTYKHGLLKR